MTEFEELAKRKGLSNGKLLWKKIGGGKAAYTLMKNGCDISYEVVKGLYNYYGEVETLKVIDFGEETIDGFKAKFIQVGDKLY
jgi:hypothetical protein